MVTLTEQLKAIDLKKNDWYKSLTPEQQEKLTMWPLMRSCSSVKSISEIEQHYLMMTNDLVNVNFNIIRKHPELQFRLMQVVGLGTKQIHPWIPPGKRKKSTSMNKKFHALLTDLYPQLNEDELILIDQSMSKDEKKEFLLENGIQKKDCRSYL